MAACGISGPKCSRPVVSLFVGVFLAASNLAPYLNPEHFLRFQQARGNLPGFLEEKLVLIEAVEAKLLDHHRAALSRNGSTRTRTGRAPRGAQVIVHLAAQCRCVPVNSDVRPHATSLSRDKPCWLSVFDV